MRLTRFRAARYEAIALSNQAPAWDGGTDRAVAAATWPNIICSERCCGIDIDSGGLVDIPSTIVASGGSRRRTAPFCASLLVSAAARAAASSRLAAGSPKSRGSSSRAVGPKLAGRSSSRAAAEAKRSR